MDRVFIEGLEIEAQIGIYDWERRIRQPLLFDIEMAFDNRRPAASDAIADTLERARHYGQRAIDALGRFESGAAKAAMIEAVEFAVARAY